MALSSRGGLLAVQHFSSDNRRPLVPHLPGGRGLGLQAEGGSGRASTAPGGTRKQFSWISPRPLWESRNDKIARWLGDSTNDERKRWVEAQRRKGVDPSIPVSDVEARTKALVHGPRRSRRGRRLPVPGAAPAPGDSQEAPTSPTSSATSSTRPETSSTTTTTSSGPTASFPGPIYAIPGNHDWYDGLNGFMTPPLRRRPRSAAAGHRARTAGQARVPRPHLARADGGAAGRSSTRCGSCGTSRRDQPGSLLRDRAEGAPARRARHRHPVRDRHRAGRVAPAGLARSRRTRSS